MDRATQLIVEICGGQASDVNACIDEAAGRRMSNLKLGGITVQVQLVLLLISKSNPMNFFSINFKDILLESAFFEPVLIAGKARNYGLHTESSLRFERGVDSTHYTCDCKH
jgi:phenylalanyl-tRNA synthetase beta subunit